MKSDKLIKNTKNSIIYYQKAIIMGFTKSQEKVINYGKGTLLVEAGPGSGKTTVIVERIKYLINKCHVDPASFLVITFTNKAADNLKYKLRKEFPNETVMKMQISTIHSFCLEYLKSKDIPVTLIDDDTSERKTLIVKKYKEELGFKKYSTIFDYHIHDILKKFEEYTSFNVDIERLGEIISDSREVTEDYKEFVDSMDYFSIKRLSDHDEQLKEEGNPDKEELFKTSWYNARFLQIIDSYKKYLNLLDKYDYVDYNTLQLKTMKKLEEEPETQYKTIFVDEFQDTDPLQFRIFQILRRNCDYFTAVGDVDQHIYAFRSSFNDFFDELIRLENLKPIPLGINFRSTESIVNLTEAFISPQRKETSKKEMESNNNQYNNKNFLIKNKNSDEESSNILEIIKYLINNGVEESDIAILYRKHKDKTISSLVENFNNEGIPFSIKGRKNLNEQPEIKSLITLMWYISRKTDIGHIPSKDELEELNLSAFSGEKFKTLWQFDQSTIDYLNREQKDFNVNIISVENKIRKENGKSSVRAAHRVRYNEDQDTLIKIFKEVQMPIIDLDEIANPIDKEFFAQLENIRNEIKSKEPPTILEVFYKLIALTNLYNRELTYKEIANIALMTQTISNYETFISDTDFKGAYLFLKQSVKKYDSYTKEDTGIQLMTIHSAKGLEFPVTFITSLKNEKFPTAVKDPNREEDTIYPNDTYYTPNECLEYKTILNKDEDGNWAYETLTIEEENRLTEEEEDRVLYVAMTRAQDLLILSTIEEAPQQLDRIKDHIDDFNFDELAKVELGSTETETEEFEDELESLEEPVVLNYSKYTKYISCPFKYDLSYNLGFARTGGKAANRGSVFHEIMETANKKLMEGEVLSKEELEEITCETYKSMFDIDENKEEYETFKNNVLNYYFKYSIEREVLDAEFDFELYVDEKIMKNSKTDFILNGAIDLIYKDSNGEAFILDYKYAEFDPEHIDGYIKQSYIYAMALSEIPKYKDLDIKKAKIHFVLSDYIYEVEINEDKMKKELAGLNQVAYEIHNEGEGFAKEPENEEECFRCSYRYFCKPKEFAEQLYEKLD